MQVARLRVTLRDPKRLVAAPVICYLTRSRLGHTPPRGCSAWAGPDRRGDRQGTGGDTATAWTPRIAAGNLDSPAPFPSLFPPGLSPGLVS